MDNKVLLEQEESRERRVMLVHKESRDCRGQPDQQALTVPKETKGFKVLKADTVL